MSTITFDDDWLNPFAVQPSARRGVLRAVAATSDDCWAESPLRAPVTTCTRGTQTGDLNTPPRAITFGELYGFNTQESPKPNRLRSALKRLSPTRIAQRRSRSPSPSYCVERSSPSFSARYGYNFSNQSGDDLVSSPPSPCPSPCSRRSNSSSSECSSTYYTYQSIDTEIELTDIIEVPTWRTKAQNKFAKLFGRRPRYPEHPRLCRTHSSIKRNLPRATKKMYDETELEYIVEMLYRRSHGESYEEVAELMMVRRRLYAPTGAVLCH